MNRAENESGAAPVRNTVKTVSIVSVGLALCVGWAVGGSASGCADATIVDPPLGDLGSKPNSDGGAMQSAVRYTAAPGTDVGLQQKAATNALDSKRDPAYVVDGTDQYMFFSCATVSTDSWSICGFKAQGSGTPPNWMALPPPSGATSLAIVSGRSKPAALWDALDVTAPSVLVNAGSSKFTMYYAGNGSSKNTAGAQRPDYVTQIGRATSSDGTNWTRGNAPILDLPAFTGTGANDTPMTQRPDAYGATDPFVLQDGANFVLYYAGLDCSSGTCTYQILRSVSTDGGMTFPAGTVVLSGRKDVVDETGGIAGPSVVKRNGKYIMAYTAVKTPAQKTVAGVRAALTTGSVGIATSDDGILWKYASANTSALIQSSASSFYSEGATAPSLYTSGTSLKLYFGGLISNITAGGTYYSIIPADLTEIQ